MAELHTWLLEIWGERVNDCTVCGRPQSQGFQGQPGLLGWLLAASAWSQEDAQAGTVEQRL